jgi:hypothetical protein
LFLRGAVVGAQLAEYGRDLNKFSYKNYVNCIQEVRGDAIRGERSEDMKKDREKEG